MHLPPPPPLGCICPPTSEQTCQNPSCGRKPPAIDQPFTDGRHPEPDADFRERILRNPMAKVIERDLSAAIRRADGAYLDVLAKRVDPNIERLRYGPIAAAPSEVNDAARVRSKEEIYFEAVYLNLVEWLASHYTANPLQVANDCDGSLDRSGRLLGEVRDKVRSAQK